VAETSLHLPAVQASSRKASQIVARRMPGRDGIHGLQTNHDMIHALPVSENNFMITARPGSACDGGGFATVTVAA
jgi:hypothetical protein